MNLRLLAFTVRPLSIALITISSKCKGRLKLQNRGTGKIEFDVWAWTNMEHYDWELKQQLNDVFDVAMLLIDVLLRTSSFVFELPTSKTFNDEVWQHDSTQSFGFRMKQMSSSVCTSVFFGWKFLNRWLVRCDPLIYICRSRNYVLKHASFPFDLCVSVCLEAQSFSASVELAMSHLDQDDVRPSPSGREEQTSRGVATCDEAMESMNLSKS